MVTYVTLCDILHLTHAEIEIHYAHMKIREH